MSYSDVKEERPPLTPWQKVVCAIERTMVTPVEYIREQWVLPHQQKSKWYHQKFRRVPTIDECDDDDAVCFTEANMQYKRDRMVDTEIVGILRQRFEDCVMYETPDHLEKCAELLQQYEEASTNWFTKYGDIGGYHDVLKCYMKQKHRLTWEKKYGEVGQGMNQEGKGKQDTDAEHGAGGYSNEDKDDDPCKVPRAKKP